MLAVNIDQVDPKTAIRPLLISICITTLLYLVLIKLLKDQQKTSLIVSLGLIFFFSYGHVYTTLEKINFIGLHLARHRYLVPIWLFLFALCLWAVLKSKQIPASILQAFSVMIVTLLIFPGFQIFHFYNTYNQTFNANNHPIQIETINTSSPSSDQPDVYFIILDMYARQDAMLKQYNYDNQDFIRTLGNLGFYVADCSLSNYSQSVLSMASQLNFDYIQNLVPDAEELKDKVTLWSLVQHSAVRQQLEARGYQTIAFETGYPFSQIKDADIYYESQPEDLPITTIRPFEALLLNTTAMLPITDLEILNHQKLSQNSKFSEYTLQLFKLNELENIPALPGKKFVFVHITVPHQPYIFKPNGEFQTDPAFYTGLDAWAVDDEHEQIGYRNQVKFINSRMPDLLRGLVEKSSLSPVILLFSDHGVYPYRNANLAAYYLPEDGAVGLYPTISSVNSFRWIFNKYFDGQFDMLPDISYASSMDDLTFDIYLDEFANCQP